MRGSDGGAGRVKSCASRGVRRKSLSFHAAGYGGVGAVDLGVSIGLTRAFVVIVP